MMIFAYVMTNGVSGGGRVEGVGVNTSQYLIIKAVMFSNSNEVTATTTHFSASRNASSTVEFENICSADFFSFIRHSCVNCSKCARTLKILLSYTLLIEAAKSSSPYSETWLMCRDQS